MNKKIYNKPKCISTSFQGIFIIIVFFLKNERQMSLHLHVSKKSRVVGKYKGAFLELICLFFGKRLDLRVVIVHTVRKRFS